jgi:hypothetical protein
MQCTPETDKRRRSAVVAGRGGRGVFRFGGVGIRRSAGASIGGDIDGGRRGPIISRAVPRP